MARLFMRYSQLFSLQRWRQEFMTPTRGISRYLLERYHSARVNKNGVKAVVVWNWNSNPITYDFIWQIFYAYHQLRLLGHHKFNLIIYASCLSARVEHEYASYVSEEQRTSRINDLIYPLASMFSCVDLLHHAKTRLELDYFISAHGDCTIYPFGYSHFYNPGPPDYRKVFKALKSYTYRPADLPFMHAPIIPTGIDFTDSARHELSELQFTITNHIGQYITLTLRDYGFRSMRNTTQYDVDKAYALSKILGISLILVPDDLVNLSSYSLPAGAFVAYGARFLLSYRAYLYSNSYVNIFTASGPAALSLFLRNAKTIYVNFGAGGCDGDYSYYKRLGLNPESQSFSALDGYLLWAETQGCYDISDLNEALDCLYA